MSESKLTPGEPRLRRLRFRLSTLFVLTTLMALVGGWSAYQLRWIHVRHEFLKSCQQELGPEGFSQANTVAGGLVRAPLTLVIFGEPGLATINFNFDLGKSDRTLDAGEVETLFLKSPHVATFQRAKELFPEASVGWGGYYQNLQQQVR